MMISCIFLLDVWCKKKHRRLEFNSIKKDICCAMCNYNKVMNKSIDSSMGTKPMPFTCVQLYVHILLVFLWLSLDDTIGDKSLTTYTNGNWMILWTNLMLCSILLLLWQWMFLKWKSSLHTKAWLRLQRRGLHILLP